MIYNKYKIKGNKKFKDFTPKGKQKTFLKGVESEVIGTDYNGYGYSSYIRRYILTITQYKNFVKMGKDYKEPIRLTEEEKKIAWCKRLVKLYRYITIDEALDIAEEKIDYKNEQIYELGERQGGGKYSRKRENLINSIKRSNPLRRIEDCDHAAAIVAASERHRDSDYEDCLEEGKEKALLGEIDRGNVKEYALEKMKYV